MISVTFIVRMLGSFQNLRQPHNVPHQRLERHAHATTNEATHRRVRGVASDDLINSEVSPNTQPRPLETCCRQVEFHRSTYDRPSG